MLPLGAPLSITGSTVLNDSVSSAQTWVFGYGSIIWNPGFTFEEKCTASYIGWQRRFWQGSHDHRGTPAAPGRVVTLVPAPEHRCRGMAFRLADADAPEILAQLDYREKNGYERILAPLWLDDGRRCNGITYIASADNPAYLGDANADAIAQQIASSTGPSGRNRDYLFELATAFRELAIDDPHVFDLEQRVRALTDKPDGSE